MAVVSDLHAARTLTLRSLHFVQPYLDFLCGLRVLRSVALFSTSGVLSICGDLTGKRGKLVKTDFSLELSKLDTPGLPYRRIPQGSMSWESTTGPLLLYSPRGRDLSQLGPTSHKKGA